MPKTLCITIGDPLGIGPEVVAKFLAGHVLAFPQIQFQVFGDLSVLMATVAALDLDLPQTEQVQYHSVSSKQPGDIAYQALVQAVQSIASGQAHALVTGPISKKHLQEAQYDFEGHTEILEYLAQEYYPRTFSRAQMLFVYKQFRLLLLTRHIPLEGVSPLLMAMNLREPLDTLIDFLREDAAIEQPRIAMLGVNPHAGEVGGGEEALALKPVMAQLNAEGQAIFEGPFSADAFFRGFELETFPYDAVVAAYHDQGLIPFKLIAGHRAVNVTLGLPFIRTSVGHGTAFDIAGKGIASEQGLIEAVNTAIELIETKASALSQTASAAV